MATQATFVKATPYSVVYQLTADDGNPGAIDFSDGPTLARLAPGPLKAEITKRLGTLDTLNLNNDSARVRIYFVSGVNLLVPIPATITVVWATTGLAVTLPATGIETPVWTAFFEIRFIHSKKR